MAVIIQLSHKIKVVNFVMRYVSCNTVRTDSQQRGAVLHALTFFPLTTIWSMLWKGLE